MGATTFLAELKRRKVFRVAILYLIAAWPLIQAGSIYLPTFNAPIWVNQTLLIAYLLGFPITLLLSWFLQIKPGGIKADLGPGKEAGLLDLFNWGSSGTSGKKNEEEPDVDAVVVVAEFGDPKSIAVLPLENLSPNPDNAYFASGVHEEILDQLTKISDLKVISRTAVLKYSSAKQSPSEIGRALKVSNIMEGSVRFAANRVRVTTQLIHAEDDVHLWSQSYEFELDDIFRIQSDVAKRVANAMQATLRPGEVSNLDRPATESPQAYTLYLRHRYQYSQEQARPTLDENAWLQCGIQRMREAIVLDPNFARGIAELGWLIWYKGLLSKVGMQDALYNEAANHALQAIAIDPQISRAYQVLQRVYFHRRQWDKWEEYARQSVRLPDLDGNAAFNLALTLGLAAHYPESYHWFDVVLQKNPSFLYYWELAVTTRISGGDYRNAMEMAEQYLAVGADRNAYHTIRAYCFYRLGQELQMMDEFRKIQDYGLRSTFIHQFLDYMRSMLGQKDQVLSTLMQLPDDYTKGIRISFCGAGANDLDLVFFAYKAIMENNGHIHFSEVMSDEIRDDERFKAVEKYMSLPRQGEYIEF